MRYETLCSILTTLHVAAALYLYIAGDSMCHCFHIAWTLQLGLKLYAWLRFGPFEPHVIVSASCCCSACAQCVGAGQMNC